MKKIKQNTVQINNNELQKCKLGQEFKVDVITHVKSKSKSAPPNDGNGGGGRGHKDPKPTFQQIVLAFIEEQKLFNKNIQGTLKEHTDIFKRNNLH
jgi:hypothetical protein